MTSKQSGTPNHPSDQNRSTTSWTIPEPADVISYSYLWAREAEEGQEEGLKDRPVVVVLARIVEDDQVQLLVAPVTHSQPRAGEGIPIPPLVKRHLDLDADRSWIVTTELNRFVWPGPDIRPAKSSESPLYGAIPARLFEQIRQEILTNNQGGQVAITKRTE